MDLEGTLTGENLIFYKNIQDLKVLTTNARALITRSHAVYKDILQGHVFHRPVRGTEQQEEDLTSLRSLHGECIKCGLQHGAQGFCIVHEIMKAEENQTEGPIKSVAAQSQSLEASSAQLPKSSEKSHKDPPKDKVKEWESLLYRKMTQEELDYEYFRICHMYGVASGRKFLLARSMAQEPDEVEPLFPENHHVKDRKKVNSRITSITRDCATAKKVDPPRSCPNISPYVRNKMSSVLDWALPCESKVPKEEKVWKNALKPKPKSDFFYVRETTEDNVSISPSYADQISADRSEWCYCVHDQCDCGVNPTCNLPEKKCLTVTDYQNNYLFTVRENLRKRRLNKGRAIAAEHQSKALLSLGELPSKVSLDAGAVRKDSELMMEKANALHQKELKNCIKSKIGVDDVNLDENVSKLAEHTAVFTKPDDKAWDEWIELFKADKGKLEDADDDQESGDSDIPTSCDNSMTSSSTTDREIQNPQPTARHIPFVQEPLKLVDILFDKIYTRFVKSTQKNLITDMTRPYKRFFFSHVDNLISLTSSDCIAKEVVSKLKLSFPRLKTLIPKTVLRAQRLKRLEGKNKNLSKTVRRRNYIEGIQLGKRYRRKKNSLKFTKGQGYIGFKAEERKLLETPTPQRFAACDLVGDGYDVLLSRERIHYHYRLLKTLFNGSAQSEDKESLMDEGMKERLQKFKKTLRNQSQFGTDSETEDEDGSMVKASSVSAKWPLKRNEMKLKSTPGNFAGGPRSNHTSQTLSSRLNESKLFNEAYPRTGEASSYKSSSKGIPSLSPSVQPDVTARAFFSTGSSRNGWDGYTIAPSLLEGLLPKASKHFSQKLSSTRNTYPTRSDLTKVPTRKHFSQSYMSKESSNRTSLSQSESFRLPTPPLSESSCGEADLDFIQHRIPPKEEAHIEKSARIDVSAREKQSANVFNPQLRFHGKQHSQRMEESELSDKSSDSYVPKLLKIPPKRTSTGPASLTSHALKGAGYHKSIRSRASIPYLSDSSSTDSEPTNPLRQKRRERRAWDHDSGLSRRIAPYLDTEPHTTNNINLPTSGQRKANYGSRRTREEKSSFTSPLPKAVPSILKKNPLPKPPSDGASENQSKIHGLGKSPMKRQSFSDSSYRTTSWPSEGLVRPARVVTERLLKATQVNPNVDHPAGSTRKHSEQSRGTPDTSTSISPSASRKTSRVLTGASKSGHVAVTQDDSSNRLQPTVTINPSTGSSAAHRHAPSTPDDVADPNHPQRTNSLSVSSSKKISARASKIANEVFRRRSLVLPPDQIEKHEPQLKNKAGKKAAEGTSTQQDPSISSLGSKLKKLEAIGPTRRKCFNVDIGQGINCVNYLKENAPGADDIKKKDLVDLLVTPVLEVKKAPKKATPKVESSVVEIAIVKSQLSALDSSSSLAGANNPASQRKIRAFSLQEASAPRKDSFKTLDQIYKEVHGINKNNTPKNFLENDYEYETKKKQQLKKHKIFP